MLLLLLLLLLLLAPRTTWGLGDGDGDGDDDLDGVAAVVLVVGVDETCDASDILRFSRRDIVQKYLDESSPFLGMNCECFYGLANSSIQSPC